MSWPREECIRNGCDGCLGISLSCGHSFSCARDPGFGTHRCSASYTNALFALLMGVTVFIAVWGLMAR